MKSFAGFVYNKSRQDYLYANADGIIVEDTIMNRQTGNRGSIIGIDVVADRMAAVGSIIVEDTIMNRQAQKSGSIIDIDTTAGRKSIIGTDTVVGRSIIETDTTMQKSARDLETIASVQGTLINALVKKDLGQPLSATEALILDLTLAG